MQVLIKQGSYRNAPVVNTVFPLVKGLIEVHGGSVSIRSKPGNGTQVLVSFPARRVLDGPRGEVMTAPGVNSESQRKLIAITG